MRPLKHKRTDERDGMSKGGSMPHETACWSSVVAPCFVTFDVFETL
jgi:hypothetical protein